MSDPAVLFYISDWFKSTAEMDADCRGWYLNLLLHNYDKKDLPNDIEKLAVMACVKFSEYERFKQVFEQVLKHKFEQNDNGRLSNPKTNEVLKSREMFLDKRSNAGKTSYMMKYFYKNYPKDAKKQAVVSFIKDRLDLTIDCKDEQMLKQMFKHLFELYRNEIENENESNNDIKKELVYPFDSENFMQVWNVLINQPKWKKKSKDALQASLKLLSKLTEVQAIETMNASIAGGWKGLFPDKSKKNNTKNAADAKFQQHIDSHNGALELLKNMEIKPDREI